MKKPEMEQPALLVLASGSPRRADLLRQAGLVFQVDVPNVDEACEPGTPPSDEAALAASRKCAAVVQRRPDSVVLAADTIVELDGRSLGKPADLDGARGMLAELSCRKHTVVTAVCIEHMRSGRKVEFRVESEVRFGSMSKAAVEEYLSAVEVLDKAGAYGIQERPDLLGASVKGSVDNVVGLPVAEVVEALGAFGIRRAR